jgi:4-diphosphocytidyl-2-C-methyl-D-erythritol kinase
MLRKLLKKMLNLGFVENSQSESMLKYPPSKINIGLYVTDRRDDGYHNIYSLFYPLKLCDILEWIPGNNYESPSDKLELTGMVIPGAPGENLLYKVCDLIRERAALPGITMHLHKKIPVGAGLGGGSSDAASLLKVLGSLSKPALKDDDINAIALKLGSDCPFFLNPVPGLAKGRGEVLSDFNPLLQAYWLSVFNPGIHISTSEAYKKVKIGQPEYPLHEVLKEKPEMWKGKVNNVFEEPVFNMFPAVKELKEELYKSGAVYASMTGSGSSVFGIFRGKPAIRARLARSHIWTEEL